jgi:beta-xylosidase
MGSRFGRGVYAGSLRFHDGRYWMHFTTLDEGIFVTTTEDPAGKWSEPVCLSPEPMWDDPRPLWDADGSAWLVASNPGPSRWFSYLIPMAPDGLSIDLHRREVLDDCTPVRATRPICARAAATCCTTRCTATATGWR